MIITWRRGGSSASLRDDALSALTAADWTAPAAPVAWLHWPVDQANPYQALLYSRFAAHNLIPIRLFALNALEQVTAALPAGVSTVLHVHWLYDVTKGLDAAAALAATVSFEQRITALRRAGVRLVWTVHNTLPHEMAHPEVEKRLRRFMLSTADLVHVMHDSHPALLKETFGVSPAQVAVAPHPSLCGALPDYVDQRTARATLGLPLGARVLVTFGQIRPYKGHLPFLDAFDRASTLDPRLRWLVAGKVRDEPGGAEFRRRAAEHPAVLLHPGFVPDGDAQLYLRAADAAVFPYLRSLNSGAVALSASFGLPAYASTTTNLADLMPDGAVARFDLDDPEATALVLAGGAIETAAVRRAVAEHAHALRPDRVSDAFARTAREWLDRDDRRPLAEPDARERTEVA